MNHPSTRASSHQTDGFSDTRPLCFQRDPTRRGSCNCRAAKRKAVGNRCMDQGRNMGSRNRIERAAEQQSSKAAEQQSSSGTSQQVSSGNCQIAGPASSGSCERFIPQHQKVWPQQQVQQIHTIAFVPLKPAAHTPQSPGAQGFVAQEHRALWPSSHPQVLGVRSGLLEAAQRQPQLSVPADKVRSTTSEAGPTCRNSKGDATTGAYEACAAQLQATDDGLRRVCSKLSGMQAGWWGM